ncbi:MAG: DEAD/DEAH box helicase [Pseudanabaenaceae cyanobacterium bins.68]|nr:DEAD/DEAH box helicase [Pseudanabaenaceae cyanobacterium bins.68]
MTTFLDPTTLFPFSLDDFQLEAIAALNANRSVVVCAPTGSGKTLIGEFAIYRALNSNSRVFYTTPLKALSNQKLRDFRDRFGHDQVGLLTGDISINRDAPIVVMTTEIFRNMLYGTPIGEVGTSLEGLQTVVLDECHYMNDSQRGTVWEESIIYCPAEVQLVALSATVANSQQLTDWIDRVHGSTELIYSDFRPVPLKFYFCNQKGLFPLLDDQHQRLNPKLRAAGSRAKIAHKLPKHVAAKSGVPKPLIPTIGAVVSQLQNRDMLPAIYFIFSRRGCDQAIAELEGMTLVDQAESTKLRTQIDNFLASNPEVGRTNYVQALYRGIAAHHAGILPAWKGLVEELFQQGLVKVVFATETLAAGINMPARTTVISSISKRTDVGHRRLKASEFLQMAGRAGRRGMDLIGHVVTVQTRYEGAEEAADLATQPADPLVSQFTPSYGMVLNLLLTHSLEKSRDLVERSFGQYLSNLVLEPQSQNLELISREISRLGQELDQVDMAQFQAFEKLRERLRQEKTALKYLSEQAEEQRLTALAARLLLVENRTLALFKSSKGTVVSGVIVDRVPGSGQIPWLICLGCDRYWHVISHKEVLDLEEKPWGQPLTYPDELELKRGAMLKTDLNMGAIAAQIPSLSSAKPAPEVLTQLQRVQALEAEIAAHPVANWQDKSSIIKKSRKLEQLHKELEFKRTTLDQRRLQRWDEFIALVEVLREFNCLEWAGDPDRPQLQPTDLGESVSAIRGDNELWLGLAIASGDLDQLAPHHLATVCAALVTENSRPDSWVDYGLSPVVEEILDQLRHTRHQIFRIQKRYDVLIPVWLEYELSPLAEQWALGVEWLDLCSHSSLDEGDIVRILRRTLDFLCQIPHVPNLSESLYQSARQAIALIDRFPISELV